MNTTRIIIFAKAPQPGTVKTRLIRALGADGAATIARRMLESTLEVASGARLGPVELCMSPDPGAAAWAGLTFPANVELTAQGDGDLGARMARAVERTIGRQQNVILLGTDCPDMSVGLLWRAQAALREAGAVIYCTADGGYALLGLAWYSDALFTEMPWGSSRVAGETLRRFARLDRPVSVGQVLHDVDEPDDLRRLPADWLRMIESQRRMTEAENESSGQ